MAAKRLGLIGCGGRLTAVVKHLREECRRLDLEMPEVTLVHDPSEKMLARMEGILGLEAPPRRAASVEELCTSDEVDWVMIGSWNCFHAEQAIAAFEAGKDVFCEKPLATTPEDCLAMRDAWKKSGRAFVIGFILRYSLHYRRMKDLIESGYIGRPLSMEFNETLAFAHGGYIHSDWRRKTEWAGTHLLEKCCHDLDLVNWLLASRPARVASFGGVDYFLPENRSEEERLAPFQGRAAYLTWHRNKTGEHVETPFNSDKDIIDNQVAILQYESGVRATFHTNCCTGLPERRMYIAGDRGTLRADVLAGTIEAARFGIDEKPVDFSTTASGGHGGGEQTLGQSLAACLYEGAESMTTLEDGLTSAFTAFGIDEAMATGQIVEMEKYWAML